MESVILKKLDIKGILSESIQVYKSNVGLLIILSILSFALAKVSGVLLNLKTIPFVSDNMFLLAATSIVGLIIAYVVIFYSIRVSVAIELAVRDLCEGKSVTVLESYKNAKGYAWQVFLTVLVLILMLTIPFLVIRSGLKMQLPFVMRVFMIIIGGVSLVFIGVKNGLAPITRVLAPEIGNHFWYSNKLVKGNFKEVLALFALSYIGFAINFALTNSIELSSIKTLNIILFEIVPAVITILFRPFQACIMVITFLRLVSRR